MRVKRLFSEEDEKIEKWIAQTFAKMDFDDVVASLNRALVFLPKVSCEKSAFEKKFEHF